ncbi:MAG: hydrogenase maturation protease [Sedimentisphaerales bacterium]|nr:hydrogenase maturation protease [Sedimentisphaerales bacterium]
MHTDRSTSVLVLALGNDIKGDDAVALEAVQILKKEGSEGIDFVDTIESGLALLELMSGYDKVLLLDSVSTGVHPVGTILEFSPDDFNQVLSTCRHFMGLPEVIELAKRLSIDFPDEIRILAMEIAPPYEFSQTLTAPIRAALPSYIQKAGDLLKSRG